MGWVIDRDAEGRAVRLGYVLDTPSGVTPLSGAQEASRCACGRALTGRQVDYCSRRCKDEEYNRTHPVARQQSLPLDERQPYLAARTWLLGRLQRGPVSTLELRRDPWPASMNPAERVRELRVRHHDIRTERVGRGYWYQLWIDGEPVGRLPK